MISKDKNPNTSYIEQKVEPEKSGFDWSNGFQRRLVCRAHPTIYYRTERDVFLLTIAERVFCIELGQNMPTQAWDMPPARRCRTDKRLNRYMRLRIYAILHKQLMGLSRPFKTVWKVWKNFSLSGQIMRSSLGIGSSSRERKRDRTSLFN